QDRRDDVRRFAQGGQRGGGDGVARAVSSQALPDYRDYYDLLEVPRDATDAELKAAYRRLALQFHPDKNPGDRAAEERFKELAAAYAILPAPEKRARYDRFGAAAAGDPFAGSPWAGVQELFGGLFGGVRRKRPQGRDLRYTLELELAEAAF